MPNDIDDSHELRQLIRGAQQNMHRITEAEPNPNSAYSLLIDTMDLLVEALVLLTEDPSRAPRQNPEPADRHH